MLSPALSFANASFGYGEEAVVRGVDFALRPHELIGLIGPNGSGKTTLVRGATRVLEPSSGSVELAGQPLSATTRRELARQIAVVPQEAVPVFPLTVLECVLMGRTPWLGAFEFESERDLAIADEALAAVGALELRRRPLAQLSGGERRRVIVARALAQQAKVLVADEPTAHLDVRHAVDLFAMFDRLRREADLAVVLVTHDLNLAAKHCDRLILLADGRVLAQGTPREVLTSEQLSLAFGTELEVTYAGGEPRMIGPRQSRRGE